MVDSLETLDCDRALSTKHWGIGFGPLSGVVTSNQCYFDRSDTYNTGALVEDYLETAKARSVQIRIGIYFDNGNISFFRLPEGKTAWECTGVVHQAKPHQTVFYPSAMFWRLSSSDEVEFELRGMQRDPPFDPHFNFSAQEARNWTRFSEPQEVRENPEDYESDGGSSDFSNIFRE